MEIGRTGPIRLSLGMFRHEYGAEIARYKRLEHWIKAVVRGDLKLNSVLINISEKDDLFLNDEHLDLPFNIINNNSPTAEDFKRLTVGEGGIWEKFDLDDGFDPNQEYVIPAIAFGIVGKFIRVDFYDRPGRSRNGQIAFGVDTARMANYLYIRSERLLPGATSLIKSVFVPEGDTVSYADQRRVISIPYETIGIRTLLKDFAREGDRTYILMGERRDVPPPYTLEEIERVVMPKVSG